jgi:hypothetical protein
MTSFQELTLKFHSEPSNCEAYEDGKIVNMRVLAEDNFAWYGKLIINGKIQAKRLTFPKRCWQIQNT